jgi:ABC-type uncharacterized transport system involved in gliding motility auxiliary subunit
VERSASLFGLLGVVFIAFGALGAFVDGPASPFCWGNVGIGALLLLGSVVFGFENVVNAAGRRSTRYGAGAVVYSLLFVALVGGLNYLGTRYHTRWDLTEAGVHTLAPQSRSVVAALEKPLEMIGFADGGIDPELASLLDGFRYVARDTVTTRLADPDREPALVEQLKITSVPSVSLRYGDETFVVTQPTEENVTNGIIRVARTSKKTVYVAQGFGQAPLDDPNDPKGYAAAKIGLEQENYDVQPLVWPAVAEIPAEASAVVVPGIDGPLPASAIAVLDAYLERGGHVLLMVGPRQGDAELATFLSRWGVKLGDDIVVDQQLQLLGSSVVGLQPLATDYGDHPITKGFRGYTTFPQTRTVEPDATGKKGLTVTPLVRTGPASWAEASVEQVYTQGTVALDPDDRRGPLSVAVAVTANLSAMDLADGADGATEARLVVVGTPSFADSQEFTRRPLNGDLFLNAIGWLVGQSETISVRSRTVRASRAELTPAQARRIMFLSIFIIPEMLVLLGVSVWWWRRSR